MAQGSVNLFKKCLIRTDFYYSIVEKYFMQNSQTFIKIKIFNNLL